MSSQIHRLATYNVLSSHLCEPDYFKSCDRTNLDPEIRLERITKKLIPEIEQETIILLQEISTLWAGKLHSFFVNHNYYLITGLYGTPKNGYMGVATALPINRYEILDVKIERLTDSRDWSKLQQFEVTWRQWLKKIADQLNIKNKLEHPQHYAQRRFNQYIFVKVKDKVSQETFTLMNYHMPCVFFVPQVMTIHSAMIAQRTEILSQDCPFLLAGDFNIRPQSPQYQLLTTGKIPSNHPHYPLLLKDDPWQPNLKSALKSAYYEFLGKEPDFTNYSKIKDKDPFIDTLDYIWLSDHWQVKEVLPLPTQQQLTGFLPNEIEPSDHLLLRANMTINH